MRPPQTHWMHFRQRISSLAYVQKAKRLSICDECFAPIACGALTPREKKRFSRACVDQVVARGWTIQGTYLGTGVLSGMERSARCLAGSQIRGAESDTGGSPDPAWPREKPVVRHPWQRVTHSKSGCPETLTLKCGCDLPSRQTS